MTLSVSLRVAGRLEVEFQVEPGEVLAVVGPNGSGKTTLLRALAGVQDADGTAVLAGRDLMTLPAQDRAIGWLPQQGTLFPHLSVLGNAAYGLRARGVGRRTAQARARSVLADLGIADLADRRPAELSGGQAQRAALARALAVDPALVLLDEPLASLDVAVRHEVRAVLQSVLRGTRAATLLVTHDPVDVATLADRVLVLAQGRVLQAGPAADVLRAPGSPWVAGLLGLNAWPGVAEDGRVTLGSGAVLVSADSGPTGGVLAVLPPTAVALHRSRPTGSPRNVVTGVPVTTTSLAGRVRVTLDSVPSVTAEVTAAAATELDLGSGQALWASFKATELQLVPTTGVADARTG